MHGFWVMPKFRLEPRKGMVMNWLRRIATRVLCLPLVYGLVMGCHSPQACAPPVGPVPHEGTQVSLHEYVVNPPDILFIEMEATPSAEQVIQPADLLAISVEGTLPDNPINDVYPVQSDGTVSLGVYGAVQVAGITVAQAKQRIKTHLKGELANPEVNIHLSSIRPISGEYLVRPDGFIKLGFYGSVHVANLPLSAAESAIKEHLQRNYGLVDPKVSVDVASYNSMVYYVVADGAGYGDQVTKLPFTGRETVLDAIGEIGGLPQFGSKCNIWVSRPVAGDPDVAQILPVDWKAIVKRGATTTNYQLMPGDRLYVKSDHLVNADNFLAKFLSPIERVFGTITLVKITQNLLDGQGFGGGGAAGT